MPGQVQSLRTPFFPKCVCLSGLVVSKGPRRTMRPLAQRFRCPLTDMYLMFSHDLWVFLPEFLSTRNARPAVQTVFIPVVDTRGRCIGGWHLSLGSHHCLPKGTGFATLCPTPSVSVTFGGIQCA